MGYLFCGRALSYGEAKARASLVFTFASDNAAGVHPRILQAINACNAGFAPPYGGDDWSKKLNATFSDVFEHPAFVFPVSTGTAANGLALASITPSYGTVFCHSLAHILNSEAGSVEFYSGGSRLVPLQDEACKLSPAILENALDGYGPTALHQMKASSVSLTQATERGTVYTLEELKSLAGYAHSRGLKVHMDGARFANALVALGATPAEMTWKAGVDVVSFGATKNGTMMAEAVVVFDPVFAEALRIQHKRAGFLHSKMRYFASQLLAYLEDGLWLANARHANAMARKIADCLIANSATELAYPVESNQIFAYIPPETMATLKRFDIVFRTWAGPKPNLHRLVLSYADDESVVNRLRAALKT
jgi:threonine aldolase